jgi:hypothetical protein
MRIPARAIVATLALIYTVGSVAASPVDSQIVLDGRISDLPSPIVFTPYCPTC